LAESPFATLARILGGVVLLQGNLGHQVLGQLLIANTNEVALAGAFAVVAGATGPRNVAGQIALRTVVPALAVRAIISKELDRVERKTQQLEARERAFEKRRRARVKRRRRLSTPTRARRGASPGGAV
jgi:hypothetical protein